MKQIGNQGEYVSFETAKMLKKAGFDWYTKNRYSCPGDFMFSDESGDWNAVGYLERYSAPKLSFAARWIREKYKFNISALWDSEKCCYYEFVQKITDKDDHISCSGYYPTYEEAFEEGINVVLSIVLINDGHRI